MKIKKKIALISLNIDSVNISKGNKARFNFFTVIIDFY